MVTIRDNKDYIRVLLYSYYTTITGITLHNPLWEILTVAQTNMDATDLSTPGGVGILVTNRYHVLIADLIGDI